ncbi:alpha/beta fold hydrolase [Ningiella sp. W23]|uniref:bifunctional alpha/beta hydrolase/OsmC family protein n=1 Tax=Ningiella sp. W23 TaxID=3023715 RepID=UPI0037581C3E
MREKVNFKSGENTLSGLLEKPSGKIKAYALFAHCFTCGKDIAAASRISTSLVEHGFAVLRFDFTGLGNSDGDFSNTNFSSNLDDVLAAAAYLSEHHLAPQMLVGHSLGGAAMLSIQDRLQSVKAIVTIGSPATAKRVVQNFVDDIGEIQNTGLAHVKLGMRSFTIKKQFLDDLDKYSHKHFSLAGKALLVMHSPIDEIVPISQAEKIYQWAKHPKSFISLNKADHLLTNKADTEYVAKAISGWAEAYIVDESHQERATLTHSDVLNVEEKDHKFTNLVLSNEHAWLADEPIEMGGQNLGPSPFEHLKAALGTCTSMTIRMYADLKKLPLEHVSVSVKHQKNDDGSQTLAREISLIGDVTDAQRQRLLEIANKCPVHKTLSGTLHIDSVLAPKQNA